MRREGGRIRDKLQIQRRALKRPGGLRVKFVGEQVFHSGY